MSRPQILFLTHRVPHPPNRGDRIRTYHMLRHLSQHADVSLACLADEPVSDETHRELNRLCVRVGIVPVEKRLRWVRAGLSLLRGRTISEGAFQSPALKSLLTKWGETVSFDATLASSSALAQYLKLPALRRHVRHDVGDHCGSTLRVENLAHENRSDWTGGLLRDSRRGASCHTLAIAAGDVPNAFVDLIDVDSQKWLDYAAASRGPRSWLYRHEGSRMRSLEMEIAKWARQLFVVSEAEADIFRSFCPNGPITAISNGVDVDYFQPQRVGSGEWGVGSDSVISRNALASGSEAQTTLEPDASVFRLIRSEHGVVLGQPLSTPHSPLPTPHSSLRTPHSALPTQSCVFVGALDYKPNIDGAVWFCRKVWPQIRAIKSNAVIKLVGREPTAEVRSLGEIPGVEVVGTVPDVRPYLAEAAVAVVPLHIARGVQNKVLEAMAMGKAIVASPEPIVGLAVEPGVHLLRASNADEWVSQVTTLLDDAALRADMGLAAQAYVTANHRWEQCLEELPRIFECRSTPNGTHFMSGTALAAGDSSENVDFKLPVASAKPLKAAAGRRSPKGGT